MKLSVKATILKVLKITGIAVATILLLLFLLPILFPGKIAREVKTFANGKLEGELTFTEANLSFFNHFPSLTVTLENFSLKGSAPFKKDTLISAHEIAFGINIKSLIFDKKVNIDKIFLSNALINVKVNEKGEANYNVYVSADKTSAKNESETSLRLEKIDIENSHLIYDDQSTKILIDAKGFDYIGSGDLDQSVFDIYTEAGIDALNLTYEGQHYLTNKKVHASLITKINTSSLAFVFEQNSLKINKLPVEFTGKFDFLKNGYEMDFNISSTESELNDFFTALPPEYVKWLEKTSVKGQTDLALSLKGQYIAAENKKPDLAFNMKIRKGLIEYKEAPFPVSNIFLNFDAKLPALDTKNLKVTVDSLFFNVGEDYVKAIIKSEGIEKPSVDAIVKASIDLQKMDAAFGLHNFGLALKGILKADMVSKGTYDKAQGIFPVSKGHFDLKNGYLKTKYYPKPIAQINIKAQVSNGGGTFKDTKFSIKPASFVFEGKPVTINASFENLDDVAYDIRAKGEIDLAKVYRVFSRKGLDLKGYIKADVAFKGKQSDATNGRYANLQNSGTLLLKNIRTKSEYLPKPFLIKEGLFTFRQDNMDFSNFIASYGQSDFKMSGAMQNVINFVLSDKEILKGHFNFTSKFINADEFMAAIPQAKPEQGAKAVEAPKAATGVIIVPPNFDFDLTAHAEKVSFNGLDFKNAKANLLVAKGALQLKNAAFGLIGCNVKMDIAYGSETARRAYFDFKVAAKDFDIKRAYKEIPMFREMATAAESAEGIVSLDYKVGGKLDANMSPVYPSLLGGGTLSVKKVKMKGFRMFNAVSKKTGKDGISNPDVTKVDIKTTVKNNIITIERFKFKVAGFRPRIEGTSSFDGRLNIKMRLGLPPLGIIGIPLTITGTQESPKVKLGRNTQDLEETIYTNESPLKPAEPAPAATETKP